MSKSTYFVPTGSWTNSANSYQVMFGAENYDPIDITDKQSNILIDLSASGELFIDTKNTGAASGYMPAVGSNLSKYIISDAPVKKQTL